MHVTATKCSGARPRDVHLRTVNRRVITHGETGFFAYDDREWHACLADLVTDPSLRERVGTAARQHVLERYSVERIVAEYLQLFDRLLGHPT